MSRVLWKSREERVGETALWILWKSGERDVLQQGATTRAFQAIKNIADTHCEEAREE